MWNLATRETIKEQPIDVSVSHGIFLDDDWVIVTCHEEGHVSYRIQRSVDLDEGPKWAQNGIQAHRLLKARNAPVWLFQGRSSAIFDARTPGLQTLGTSADDSNSMALHPDGGICAIAEYAENENLARIRFVSVGDRRRDRRIRLDANSLVFSPDGDSVWLNPEGERVSYAFRVSDGERTRRRGQGIVVGALSGGETWSMNGTDPDLQQFVATRTGISFSQTSIEVESPVTDVLALRFGNLLFHYAYSGTVEVRDRATLNVLARVTRESEMRSLSDRCALDRETDLLGLFVSNGVEVFYEFYRAEALEKVSWRPTQELGHIADLEFSSLEKCFFLFYQSGWVEKLSPDDLSVVETFRLTGSIQCSALSEDGRTIAIKTEERAELFGALSKPSILTLPGSLVRQSDLVFSPKGNSLFSKSTGYKGVRTTIWWAAPRREE